MIEIRTLGGLSATKGDVAGTSLTRRRPLALLAILAEAAPHPVSRDKVMARLWPDVDANRARNALSQTLFAIRRDLAEPDVIAGRSDLLLNLSVASCDLTRFSAAISRSDHRAAISLYAGPFLDGFFLSDAPEFEQWVEDTRSRIARRAVGSLKELANAAERAGDHHQAADWCWRITEVDPFDSAAALSLVRALAASGERSHAVRFARHHEVLLRREIGAGVNPEMTQLITRLLDEGRSLPTTDLAPPSLRRDPLPRQSGLIAAPVASRPGESLEVRSIPARWRRLSWSFLSMAVIGLAATAMNARDWFADSATANSEPERGGSVAVLPFTVRGAAEAQYLREGLVELLSRGLDLGGDRRPVDARLVLRMVAEDSTIPGDVVRSADLAARLQVAQFVLGDVTATPSSIRISASIYDRSNGLRLLAGASVDGRADELLSLVDQLSAQLLAARPGGRPSGTGIASLSTRSLPALKAYLTAQSHRRSARYAPALEAYQEAVRLDSTFALAWYGLSNVADWAGRSDLVIPAARAAERLSKGLTEHDGLLTQAYLAFREDRMDAAERLYQTILHSYPHDAESWYQLGELYFHSNSRRGRSFAEARAPFQRVRELNPGDHEALMHLVRVALRTGSEAEVDSLTRLAMAEAPGPEGRELRAVRAFALRDTAAQAASLRELKSADGITLGIIAWRVSVYVLDFQGAERILRLATGGDRAVADETAARTALAHVLAGQGRMREAFAELSWLDRGTGWPAREALHTRAALVLGLDEGPGRAASIDSLVPRLDSAAAAAIRIGTGVDSGAAWIATCFSGLAAIEMGRIQQASRIAAILDGVSGDLGVRSRARHCSTGIRARMDLKQGRTRDALQALLAARKDRIPESASEILDRALIAQLFVALGQSREAESWFASMAQRGLEELQMLARSERRLGQLAEQRGDHTGAVRHYRTLGRLWANSDAALQSQVDTVRQRVGHLTSPPTRRSSPGSGPSDP